MATWSQDDLVHHILCPGPSLKAWRWPRAKNVLKKVILQSVVLPLREKIAQKLYKTLYFMISFSAVGSPGMHALHAASTCFPRWRATLGRLWTSAAVRGAALQAERWTPARWWKNKEGRAINHREQENSRKNIPKCRKNVPKCRKNVPKCRKNVPKCRSSEKLSQISLFGKWTLNFPFLHLCRCARW